MTEQRGWRVGHQGRDRMYYEERRNGSWERLDLDGEMLMGPAHHVIYFASAERWQTYPAWARDRRDEIIARITSEFREPDYEYHGLTGATGPTPGKVEAKISPQPPLPPRKSAATDSENRALLVAVLVLFVIAAAMAWLVVSGLTGGETYLPVMAFRSTVSRAQEPVTLWTSIGIYAAVGIGTLTLGALGVRAGRRLTR